MSEGRETAMRGCRFELVKTVHTVLESSEDTVPLEKGARYKRFQKRSPLEGVGGPGGGRWGGEGTREGAKEPGCLGVS